MRICDLLTTDPRGKQEVLGQISWDGEKLHLSEGLNPSLLGTVVLGENGPVTGRSNPGEWFERLPKMFSGSGLRAKMRGGEKESDMISDNDIAARLHRALDRVLDGQRAVARDESEGRANVARRAWQTRHETGGTQKLGKHEGEGPPKKKMKTQNIKPFGWTAKKSERKPEEPDKPRVKPVSV